MGWLQRWLIFLRWVQEQGDPRRAAEVGQNSNTATSRFVSASYKTRVDEEATRLIQRIPYVRSL